MWWEPSWVTYHIIKNCVLWVFNRDPKWRFLAFWHVYNMKTKKLTWVISLIPLLLYPNLENNSLLAGWDQILVSNQRSDHSNLAVEKRAIFFAAYRYSVNEIWGPQCGITTKPFLKVTLRYLDMFRPEGKYSLSIHALPLFWVTLGKTRKLSKRWNGHIYGWNMLNIWCYHSRMFV